MGTHMKFDVQILSILQGHVHYTKNTVNGGLILDIQRNKSDEAVCVNL